MAPHRGPSPPKSPAPGAQWYDTDSRDLHEWREGMGWAIIELKASPPPAPARPPRRKRVPPPLCSDCGGERSPGSGQRCRPCYEAHAEARRAERARPAPPPQPPPPPTFEGGWRAIEALIVALRAIATLRSIKPPPRLEASPPAAEPPEIEFEPAPPPRRDPAQDHPVIARHASKASPPPDPFARRERVKPPPDPLWSPEFQAQLDKVAAGKGIVEVIPIRRAEPLYTLGGVSEMGI